MGGTPEWSALLCNYYEGCSFKKQQSRIEGTQYRKACTDWPAANLNGHAFTRKPSRQQLVTINDSANVTQ